MLLDIAEAQQFEFEAPLWLWNAAKGSWHFITVPKEESDQIKFFAGDSKRGWGSVRVEVRVGTTSWQTSVFPSKESGCYVLPIKAEVRKRENLKEGDSVTLHLDVIG